MVGMWSRLGTTESGFSNIGRHSDRSLLVYTDVPSASGHSQVVVGSMTLGGVSAYAEDEARSTRVATVTRDMRMSPIGHLQNVSRRVVAYLPKPSFHVIAPYEMPH